MKSLILIILLAYLIISNTGCSGNFNPSLSSFNNNAKQVKVDYNLPFIDSSQIRYITDLSSIAFEWDIIKDARVTGYAIYKSSVDDKKPKKIALIKDKYSTHYVDKNLKPNSIYLYQFSAIGQRAIESQKSEIKAINTLSNLESVSYAYAISNLPKKIKLIWRPHSSKLVNKYIIYKNINNSWKKIKEIDNRLSVEYIDNNLKNNSLYSYKIYAVTFNNILSKSSKTIEATTKPIPDRITQVRTTKELPKKINIDWSAKNEDIAYFNIYRSKNIHNGYKKIGKTVETSYEDIINKDGAILFYKISTTDNDSLEGEIVGITGTLGQTLNKPDAPIMSYIKLEEKRKVVIRWENQDTRTTSYTLVREHTNNNLSFLGMSKRKVYDNIIEQEFIDTDIMQNSTYKYYLYGVDKFAISSMKSPSSTIVTPKNNLNTP